MFLDRSWLIRGGAADIYTVDVPIYRPVVARPKRTGKQGKPVYRGKRPHVHKKSRCISTDFDMACLCFSCCCRGSLKLQYY